MRSELLYVPILKWKQGEQGALKELNESLKQNIIPLIEIPPDTNLSKFEGTLNNWEERLFYFDVLPELYEEYGGEIYFNLLEKCNRDYVIPVVLLSDNYEAISEAIEYSKNGIAIRLTSDDFENLEENLIRLKTIIPYKDIDLIIDLKEVNESNIGEKKIVVKAMVPDIPEINSFRNIILAGSSFPQSLSNYEKYEINYIKRYDYILWESLNYLNEKYGIRLIYSDYCINHPSFFNYIPGMSPAFNIRYTNKDSFVIIKGDSTKKGGLDLENVSLLCRKLIDSGNFNGKDFAWGDEYIHDRCTDDVKGSGNLSTWRKVGTNHHITYVINQLSNLA